MSDLKTIVAVVGIIGGIGGAFGSLGGYWVTTTRLQDGLANIEKVTDNYRNELNSMHSREDTLAQGLVTAHQEVALAQSDISGKLNVMSVNLQHVRETLDEVRNVQHKYPASLSGNGTSQ